MSDRTTTRVQTRDELTTTAQRMQRRRASIAAAEARFEALPVEEQDRLNADMAQANAEALAIGVNCQPGWCS